MLSDTEDTKKPELYEEFDEETKGGSLINTKNNGVEELDDDEIGDVNMDKLESKVWLVKVPQFLADKWKKQESDGIQIGKIRIYDEPDKSGSRIAIVLQDSPEYNDVPKKYRMQVTNEKVRNMFIFSESRDPNEIVKPTSSQANKAVPISMSGTVHHECTVTPDYTDEYKRIMRKRVLDQHKNSRKIQANHETHYNRSMLKANNGGFDTAQKKAKTDTKLARMDRKDLMNLLFASYEKYPYWSLKGLVEHTRQPTAYLKEVLSDIAKLNKRGPYTGTYSLKPEFRKGAGEDGSAAAGASNEDWGAHDGAGSSAGSAKREGASEDDMDDAENINEDDDFEDV
ncbi:transcription initiation factor IIF, beta subunit-domain-containing protein [Coemansia spiralis]|nr:transcription initiation factor IIF, beta subunit-domain-containing protein [Coemansia spiralis]